MSSQLERFENEDGTIYNVAIEIDLTGTSLALFICDRKTQIRKGMLTDFTKDDCCIIIFGIIPFALVKRIYFKEQQHLAGVPSLSPDLYCNFDICSVNPKPFLGNNIFNTDNIHNKLPTGVGLTSEAYKQRFFMLQKIRGSFLAALADFHCPLTQIGRINMDTAMFDVICDTMGIDKKARETSIQKFDTEAMKQLKLNSSMVKNIPIDNTPLRHIGWSTRFIMSKPGTIPNLEPLTEPSKTETLADEVAYKVALYIMAEHNENSFNLSTFFDEFMDLFSSSMMHLFGKNDHQSYSTIMNRYGNCCDFIKDIELGFQKMPAEWPKELSTLKAIMTIGNANEIHDFENRMRKLDSTVFERRLAWSLYGMLRGIELLSKEMKAQTPWLNLVDRLTGNAMPEIILRPVSILPHCESKNNSFYFPIDNLDFSFVISEIFTDDSIMARFKALIDAHANNTKFMRELQQLEMTLQDYDHYLDIRYRSVKSHPRKQEYWDGEYLMICNVPLTPMHRWKDWNLFYEEVIKSPTTLQQRYGSTVQINSIKNLLERYTISMDKTPSELRLETEKESPIKRVAKRPSKKKNK
jgi:hypothetical protein